MRTRNVDGQDAPSRWLLACAGVTRSSPRLNPHATRTSPRASFPSHERRGTSLLPRRLGEPRPSGFPASTGRARAPQFVRAATTTHTVVPLRADADLRTSPHASRRRPRPARPSAQTRPGATRSILQVRADEPARSAHRPRPHPPRPRRVAAHASPPDVSRFWPGAGKIKEDCGTTACRRRRHLRDARRRRELVPARALPAAAEARAVTPSSRAARMTRAGTPAAAADGYSAPPVPRSAARRVFCSDPAVSGRWLCECAVAGWSAVVRIGSNSPEAARRLATHVHAFDNEMKAIGRRRRRRQRSPWAPSVRQNVPVGARAHLRWCGGAGFWAGPMRADSSDTPSATRDGRATACAAHLERLDTGSVARR